MKMKHLLVVALLLHVGSSMGIAQDRYFWLKLSGNRVMVNVQARSIRGDSLEVMQDMNRVFIPIQQIEEVRMIDAGSIMNGALIGAGIGMVVGGVAGAIGKESRERSTSIGVSALSVGVIGGIVGSVAGSMQDQEEILDLSGKDLQEKIRLIAEALRNQ